MYNGIIFNSVTVRMLTGALAEHVSRNHIRTAVVSNHGRTEVRERLASAGVSVDVIVVKAQASAPPPHTHTHTRYRRSLPVS